VTYEITEADVAGPFMPIPQDMVEKSKLAALGYTSAAEALGEKFHASPALLRQLNPGKDLGRAGQKIRGAELRGGCASGQGREDLRQQVRLRRLRHSTRRADHAHFPAPPAASTTRCQSAPGNHRFSRNPVFPLQPETFLGRQSAAHQGPHPGRPQQSRRRRLDRFVQGTYGIHGTPEPSKIGKTQSHGCIRMTNWDAARSRRSYRPGTPAILQE
jgi:lipoprotein-anchoring transpeptidase ErfK/SrfK